MSNILLSSLMGLMFLSVIPAASYAQAVSVNEPEEETQLIENDEGYGKDDGGGDASEMNDITSLWGGRASARHAEMA